MPPKAKHVCLSPLDRNPEAGTQPGPLSHFSTPGISHGGRQIRHAMPLGSNLNLG